MIYVVEYAKPKDANAERAELWAAYEPLHKVCPRCGSNKIGQTTMGYLCPPNRNKARCICGWFGIVDDMKPIT